MATLKMPKGDHSVALGTKVTKGKVKEGFDVHSSGKHAESKYSEIGKNPSRKQGIKPNAHIQPKGGRNA